MLENKPNVQSGTLCVRIKTWSEFYQIAGWFVERTSDKWVFRGQRHSSWRLRTTIERTMYDEKPQRRETEQMPFDIGKFFSYLKASSKFTRMADAEYAMIRCFKEMISWRHYMGEKMLPYVMAMQHFGIPTRMLDFTYSLFTALYFAFQKEDVKAKRTVWALRLDRIVKWVRENCMDYTEGGEGKCNFIEIAEKIINRDKKYAPGLDGIVPVCSSNNPRMLAQQGLFLMPIKGCRFEDSLRYALGYSQHGIINPNEERGISVDGFLQINEKDCTIIKFIFDGDMNEKGQSVLEHHNLTDAVLFPDRGEDVQYFHRVKADAERILQNGLF